MDEASLLTISLGGSGESAKFVDFSAVYRDFCGPAFAMNSRTPAGDRKPRNVCALCEQRAERVTDFAAKCGRGAGDWLVWQLADSAFPTGGFAHSGGLEAAWQAGVARNAAELPALLLQLLHQAAAMTAPFLIAAHGANAPLADLDDRLDAMLSNHVANRASRLQGKAFLSTAGRVFGDACERVRAALLESPGHLPIAFGAGARALGLPMDTALRLYLFGTLRGLVSAGVRLNALGPLGAQELQAGLAPALERLALEARRWTLEDAAQTAPLLEVAQGLQDRLYSRLFQS